MSKPTSPWSVTGDRVRQRELKRDAVILAAARAFRERGFHNTSLDDIAAVLHEAAVSYREDVDAGVYPAAEHEYGE